MDILSALNILRSASDDALKCHAAETILTLQKVGERLRANLLPRTPCDSVPERSASLFGHSIVSTISPPSGSSTASSSSPELVTACEPSPHDNCSGATIDEVNALTPPATVPPTKKVLLGKGRKASDDLVSKLGRAIKKTVPWIWETSSKDVKTVLSCKRKSGEDHRLEHIRRVEGDPESDEKDKLLRLLAIRSLASEFTTEQSLKKSQTKVDELVAYVCSVEAGMNGPHPESTGRRSDVSDFVERHSHLSTAPKLANGAINNGIRHLVFEEVLRKRLQKCGLPEMCEAVSAILGLNINNFRSLPYRRMPDLVDVLLADEMKITLQREGEPENKRSVVEIIWGMNTWFTDLRAEYKNIASQTFTPEPEPRCAKRSCNTHRSADSRHSLTCQADTNVSQPTTTDLDITSTRDTETNAENQPECLDEVPVPDMRSSPGGECLPFDPHQDLNLQEFNPLQDIELVQDFDPFQDIESFQDFNPFQDFNTLPDFDCVFPHVPHVPSDTSPHTVQNFPPDSTNTRQAVPTAPGQNGQVNGQEDGGTAYLSSSASILVPETVCC